MKVTIYSKGEFMGNIIATETRLKSFNFRKYAQYYNALEVVHTPKRKRTTYRKIYTPVGGSPDILILEGWNNPEPAGMFTGNTSTHLSFDPAWQSDFDKVIDKEIEKNDLKVILDTRGHDKYYEAIREHKEEEA
jgi:hypothetical protein